VLRKKLIRKVTIEDHLLKQLNHFSILFKIIFEIT
jgi:hypothetical protein